MGMDGYFIYLNKIKKEQPKGCSLTMKKSNNKVVIMRLFLQRKVFV